MEGAIPPESVLHNLEVILSVLVRDGFSLDGANAAYELVSTCAIGFVVTSMWERSIARGDSDLAGPYRRVLEATPRRQLTHVRRLHRGGRRRPTFDEHIEVVLRAIAITNDLPWETLVHEDIAELPRSPVGRVLKRELRDEGVTTATWDVEKSDITYEKR